MSFFPSCPLTWGISVPLQTMRTSNSSLSSRADIGVRWFEAAYRLVCFWGMRKKTTSPCSFHIEFLRKTAKIGK